MVSETLQDSLQHFDVHHNLAYICLFLQNSYYWLLLIFIWRKLSNFCQVHHVKSPFRLLPAPRQMEKLVLFLMPALVFYYPIFQYSNIHSILFKNWHWYYDQIKVITSFLFKIFYKVGLWFNFFIFIRKWSWSLSLSKVDGGLYLYPKLMVVRVGSQAPSTCNCFDCKEVKEGPYVGRQSHFGNHTCVKLDFGNHNYIYVVCCSDTFDASGSPNSSFEAYAPNFSGNKTKVCLCLIRCV